METEATQTLAEIDGSLSSKRALSQTIIPIPTDDRGFEPPDSALQAQENGAGVVGGDGGVLGDIKVIGGSSSSEDDSGDEKERGGRSEGDSTVLIGDDLAAGKVELDQNGISILVQVHNSLDTVNASGNENDKGSVAENGGDPGAKLMKIPGSVSKMNQKESAEGSGEHESNPNGEENDEGGEDMVENDGGDDEGEDGEDLVENDGEKDEVGREDAVENDEEEDEGDDGEEDEGDREHEYLVGDLVWGKIRSHPWWPGQVYDASDASKYARKYNQRERRLIAYFGDGSFSWCSPSQLKPFAKDFEEMSKQSNARNFVNAVQRALDEIGRLVELKMTCSCIPEENRIGLARPSALNGGIKKGVLVPECDLSRLSIPQHEPAELLLNLRYISEVVSIANMIELTALRSWLSAFYQAKDGHKLAMYHEPVYIEGLEDKNRIGVTDINDFSGSVEAPVLGPSEEDWLSSPVHPGFGQTNKSLLQKCPGISEDKLYHRRKKKSVAELMKEDVVVEPKRKKEGVVKDVTSPGKLVSTSGKKKVKTSDDAPNQGASDFTSPSGRKRGKRKSAETLESLKSADNKVFSAKNGGGKGEEEARRDNVSSVENNDRDAKMQNEAPSQGGSDFASPPGKKRGRRKSAETSENKVLNAKNGGGEGEEKHKGDNLSRVENDEKDEKWETEAPSQHCSDFTSPPGRKRGRRKSAKTSENKVLNAKNGGEGEEKNKDDNLSRVENDERDAKRKTEAPSQHGSDFASPSGTKRRKRKSAETLGSPESVENKGSRAKNGGGKGDKETKKDKVSIVENDNRDAKMQNEAPSQGGSDFPSPSGRKRGRRKSVETLGSPESAENNVSSANNGSGEGEEETKDNLSSVKNDRGAKREVEMASASRERKKSKYLSPPFTTPEWKVKNSNATRDLAESLKITKAARIGERMTRAAGQLIGSPPIVNHSNETIQQKNPKELDSRVEDQMKLIDSIKINVSTKEVTSEICSAARNPLYLRDKNSVDMICEFISAYRSAMFINGSNYKMYHKHRSSRKRKSSSSERRLMEENLNQTGREMPESRSQRTRNEKNEDDKASTPITLMVTFPPGFPLPSKNDLVTVFSKFGPLNETETDVLYNSYCARVVFVRNSDAEEAFKKCIKDSPLGPACVNYRLRYPSAAPREHADNRAAAPRARADNRAASSASREGGKTPVDPSLQYAVDEASRLLFIKKKLEIMTSLLEKSDGNMLPETKSDLEGEMKGLLEEVSTMAKSSTSS
ncbi:Serine/threonine-protein kinase ATM [Camellia lanceoleosa]|uniref:Serine/threonine-protein kinase ATM n=1 Tax=Camellia lanceoleosa TaxID=1840588 RepID=A0ACC0I4R1_9ERIC|nr:Serine/threonine-protein kinase ATM [Camellia lanceoleosa]